MFIYKILFYGGSSVVLIVSIVKSIGRYKTGYHEWGEPELDIIQIIGFLASLVGLLLS